MSTPSVLQESQSPVQSGKNPFYEDLVFIKVKDSLLRVYIDDILFLEADRSYCKIHLSGGKVVHFCCSLSKIVEQLHSPVSNRYTVPT
jgi:DNA-binding LytR/AlgR family response regulator